MIMSHTPKHDSDYLEIEPARAKSKSMDKIPWEDEEWIAEEKLDGWRFLLHFGGGLKRPFFTGRRTSDVTGRLSEKGSLVPGLWPDFPIGYTVLDGEIMAPHGANFREIAGIMNASPEESARRVAALGQPRYFTFDCLFVNGEDIREQSMLERKSRAADLVRAIANPNISLVIGKNETENWYESIVAGGGEGIILKNICAPYGEGWLKVKKFSTLDVIITGYKEAKFGRTGKYDGLVGAVEVSVFLTDGTLVEVGQVSGMDDEMRREISANRDKYMWEVLEIAAQEFAKDRLRHPRWKRLRPEADKSACTFAKMMADLRSEKIEPTVVKGPQLSLL